MMKNLKTYSQLFESVRELTQEQLNFMNRCAPEGNWQFNPETGEVDVDGNFGCSRMDLPDFKGIRFGKVTGDFLCRMNRLTSLEGAPREVGGEFDCSDNQITSLEGAPRRVGEDFWCRRNQLTSLVGAPREIAGTFGCEENNLENLIGAPRRVGEDFWCRRNQLTSLEGIPERIGDTLYSSKNPVSEDAFLSIYDMMKKGESYIGAVEAVWSELGDEDKMLLYRPEFSWISGDELKGIKAMLAYKGIKFML